MTLDKFNFALMERESKIIHNMELEKIDGYLAKMFFYNQKNNMTIHIFYIIA